MSIFNKIKWQLVENEMSGGPGILELGTFSTKVIDWLENQKILMVIDRKKNGFLKPKRVPLSKGYVFQIRYTALDPQHSFFRGTKIHKDTEKELKDDRFSRGTHSQTGEYDYYGDEERYLKIDFRDMTCSDFIAGDFNMSLDEYLYEIEVNPEFAVEADEYTRQWVEQNTAPVYTYTEVVEEEQLAW